ncbi:MAG: UDP-4-amino-4,6-dideoxy-N-acetyl-beta-L-altrosamine N-acetyltransferase [Christensenellaceae bacterium]|jgi:UDP-4-amino-4,6-dideoxy-N-acetyl-beta-L-altrosamine N-acetyltransferase
MMDIRLKRLQKKDLDMVAEWRMSEDVTRYMNTDPVLTHEGQLRWFDALREDDTQIWWVIYMDEKPVGVLNIVNIDRANRKCEWGYYVAVKEARSMKLAVLLEWNLYDYAFYTLGVNRLYNEVLSKNENVVRLHKMCGSDIEGELKESVYKRGEYYDVTMCAILKEKWDKMRQTVEYDTIAFE